MQPVRDTSNDWLNGLHGSFRTEFCETLNTLSLNELQKYAPPKHGGLPIGHEVRVLRRFLKGQCSQLDASCFSRLYRSLATPLQRQLFGAFVLGESLSKSQWCNVIGSQSTQSWIDNRLLEEEQNGGLACRFRVFSVGDVSYVVDPLHVAFPNRVHIGQDSLNMIEWLQKRPLPRFGRYLDVGIGAGAILLQFSRFFDEAIGVDINPRAVHASQLNIELNSSLKCRVYERDVFQLDEAFRPFHLITWNAPFIFFPTTEREANLDGYGGDMGIELTIQFIQILPELLTDDGIANILSAAPIVAGDQNLLVDQLKKLATQTHLDISVYALQSFWLPKYRDFHESRGIVRFESSFLEIRHGNGQFQLFAPSPTARVTDRIRRWLYKLRT